MGTEAELDASRIPRPLEGIDSNARRDVSTRIPNILSVSFDLILIAVAPPPPPRSFKGGKAGGRLRLTVTEHLLHCDGTEVESIHLK